MSAVLPGPCALSALMLLAIPHKEVGKTTDFVATGTTRPTMGTGEIESYVGSYLLCSSGTKLTNLYYETQLLSQCQELQELKA